MFTSRGCPYHCKFCVSQKHWTKYREFSAEYVLAEMALIVKQYQVNHIHFFDDLFIVNRKRLRKIVDGFELQRFSITTSCAVRANLVDDELCEMLKRLKVTEAVFGAESFSEPVLKILKANSVTAAQNQRAIDILHRHGIKVNITMVFDAPEETRDDLIVSWKGIFRNVRAGKVNKVGWGYLRPYPGSEYWNLAIEKQIVSTGMDWSVFKSWSDSKFHMNGHMGFEEVSQIVDEWNTKCFLANLHYMDTGTTVYPTKYSIFARKQNVIDTILNKPIKDETDAFVEGEYRSYLDRMAKNELSIILGSGWEPAHEGSRWVRRSAQFYLRQGVRIDADLFALRFYIPDIHWYPNASLTIELKIGRESAVATVTDGGSYTLAVPLTDLQDNKMVAGTITCSTDFRPSLVSGSSDTRNLAVLITGMELARTWQENVVGHVSIMED